MTSTRVAVPVWMALAAASAEPAPPARWTLAGSHDIVPPPEHGSATYPDVYPGIDLTWRRTMVRSRTALT
jgi:hypothetical protein